MPKRDDAVDVRELLQQRLDEMHGEADKKSKEFEDLIRGDWSDWNE